MMQVLFFQWNYLIFEFIHLYQIIPSKYHGRKPETSSRGWLDLEKTAAKGTGQKEYDSHHAPVSRAVEQQTQAYREPWTK